MAVGEGEIAGAGQIVGNACTFGITSSLFSKQYLNTHRMNKTTPRDFPSWVSYSCIFRLRGSD
jgi:hypothetical protein